MIQDVFKVSEIAKHRTKQDILAALMEEVGELATEVNIDTGYSYKQAGEDGVIGESVDVIVCALDMIWVDSPKGMTKEDIEDVVMRIVKRKLEKWRSKL